MTESTPTTAAQQMFGEIAPKLADLSDNLLFGDIWERPQLSKRDRSLITCAAIVAMGKTDQMNTHFPRAIRNGVTQEELVEMITHMAFYAGWPSAVTAALRAKDIFGKKPE
ncbi:carboxymuconolactone decarboxylase family protein [Caballeronia zhejiangensis]|uniref:carboxymuconolactone decarboxylase family protein n=1 Tax=Caballeronia zhejiangensis TaxID=871203 RepID=UPI001EF6C607|nr:carboxymuconolactone decarboxylase family protein [Caballeronia zhejiangensis]MCG7400365.1 carboxymuconolactone decarboxylase family protein [Caballeronia zhejiangensis]